MAEGPGRVGSQRVLARHERVKTLRPVARAVDIILRGGVVRIVFALGAAAQAFLLVAIVVAVANVLRRYLLNKPWPWSDELATISVVALVLCALPLLEAEDANLRITLFERRFPTWYARILRLIRWVMVPLVTGYIAWAGVHVVRQNHHLGGTTPSLHIPLWLAYLTVPAGLAGAGIVRLVLGTRVVERPDGDDHGASPDPASTT